MWLNLLIVIILGFLAAAVDAIAGGGGLISLPALLLIGVPPQLALGTNKFAASMASLNSSITFARSGKVHFPLVKWQIPFTFIGALLGVWAVLSVSSQFLNKVVLILILIVGIYTILHKNLGMENRFEQLVPSKLRAGCCFALALGFYDGFFGPGTGSFLIFSFIALFGFDFVSASANSKVLNFVSNFASLILFAWNGKILFLYGIPMALAMILGSFLGTKLAIRRGAALVKPIFITMSLLVAFKLIYQYI
ncbi:putative permease [Desulfosporosinus acidiphilus SJ4]|uniref:Probable membrane transporter protein n=1 Tax=Desulfosporosinus acidiphilus (strain DSM 22704 / JCM 16185 / SJ4) TaxID=646529 RepID=I4D8E0_DESAJ|nr:TSUP family transporter [Desulfosporosinus acidiphilus]AFM42064.1 putative permease [Desulfosporosinus acidiphilus SJ4]